MIEKMQIINKFQVVFYLKHGVKPIDLELGRNDKMVYIFDKADTKEVWELWKQECIAYKKTVQQ